jgi:hypothetical protein
VAAKPHCGNENVAHLPGFGCLHHYQATMPMIAQLSNSLQPDALAREFDLTLFQPKWYVPNRRYYIELAQVIPTKVAPGIRALPMLITLVSHDGPDDAVFGLINFALVASPEPFSAGNLHVFLDLQSPASLTRKWNTYSPFG